MVFCSILRMEWLILGVCVLGLMLPTSAIKVSCDWDAISERVEYWESGQALPQLVVVSSCLKGVCNCVMTLSLLFYLPTAVECPNLRSPNNGNVSTSLSNQFRSVAVYSCNFGYRLMGRKRRRCQANGRWTGRPPGCYGN